MSNRAHKLVSFILSLSKFYCRLIILLSDSNLSFSFHWSCPIFASPDPEALITPVSILGTKPSGINLRSIPVTEESSGSERQFYQIYATHLLPITMTFLGGNTVNLAQKDALDP